ncbi:LLM class flavin-dependent oxidoreductase [Yinghuangia sp. ASG 101]|uniref:LLM class flavin-dependent oxidoreductase n=1 Tax=Yinghuangia sp. ASG 101 TaxID=2896848 RepID=UPI001E3C0927|nr:LLM class flavin-dependent oxidoreductase [Yinghuangia sp. ASG 101]UGQ12545.1 LLM class flavin-dependent oxidoreductase [Yinghuangia sp. ASG 101]
MKFLIANLIANVPDPHTGETTPTHQKLREVVDTAVLAEELGFAGYGIGERHGGVSLASSPAVLLAAVAERTSRIKLFTTLTVISISDPVRVAEDYATVDQLSRGRLQLMVGKGNDPRHFPLFGLDEERQWEYQEEKFQLLRRLWYEENVTWSGRFRSPLTDVTTLPRPYARPRIWHGSATSTQSTELAAKWGDPLFTANGFHPVEKYAALVNHYRRRWEEYGRDPRDAVVGSGAGGCYVARTSQEAVARYRPYWEAISPAAARHNNSPFATLEDTIERGTALVGSPAQIVDKIGRYHEAYGHQLQGIGVEGLSDAERRHVLELFASDVIPQVDRRHPSALWSSADTHADADAEAPV